MSNADETRVDLIIKCLKNNKYLAPIIVFGICIAAISTIWNSIPPTLRTAVINISPVKKLNSGWIFVGYLDSNSILYWNEGPYADVVGDPPVDPTEHFRAGNRIVLNHDRELIIINYRKSGSKEIYNAPPRRHGILQAEDHTASIIKAGTELLVRDVWIGHFPGAPYAVWLRVVPPGTAD